MFRRWYTQEVIDLVVRSLLDSMGTITDDDIRDTLFWVENQPGARSIVDMLGRGEVSIKYENSTVVIENKKVFNAFS